MLRLWETLSNTLHSKMWNEDCYQVIMYCPLLLPPHPGSSVESHPQEIVFHKGLQHGSFTWAAVHKLLQYGSLLWGHSFRDVLFQCGFPSESQVLS